MTKMNVKKRTHVNPDIRGGRRDRAGKAQGLKVIERSAVWILGLELGLGLCVTGTALGQPLSTTDVIVVGAGGAGLAAATTVAEAGLSVVVLEKMPNIGGNTLRSGGYFNAVEVPNPQTETTIKQGLTSYPLKDANEQSATSKPSKHDSLDLYYQQTLESGGGRNSPAVVKALVTHATPTWQWLKSLGLVFQPDTIQIYGGQWPRAHKPLEPRGQGYIRVLSAALLAHGGRIETDSAVESLLTDTTGRVTGVCVKKRGGTSKASCESRYAKRAVVLASGGFAANPTLLQRWAPQVAHLSTDNNPGNTGDMLLAAQKVGASLVNMETVQVVPGNPMGQAFQVRLDVDIARSILVNQEGKRFIEEDAPRNVLSRAIVQQQNPQSHEAAVFSITNQATVDTYDFVFQRDIYRGLETGASYRAGSIVELERLIHVREGALAETLRNYNRMVERKEGKCARLQCQPLANGPFWASPITMTIHSTLGGVAITEKGEVLREDGTIIPGLYAAGEVTGNVHGQNRLGGNGLTDAITFGRISGKQIINLYFNNFRDGL